MSRPTSLRFDSDNLDWRSVPMPASNLPFQLRRLDSTGDSFVIHGRFPAGFERNQAGGYMVPEEVIILDGDLAIEGTTYHAGDMIVIPAKFRRTTMTSAGGCEVIAWFGGPAVFLHDVELRDPVLDGIQTASLGDRSTGVVFDLAQAEWVRTSTSAPLVVEVGDVLDLALSTWRRVIKAEVVEDALVRIER